MSDKFLIIINKLLKQKTNTKIDAIYFISTVSLEVWFI